MESDAIATRHVVWHGLTITLPDDHYQAEHTAALHRIKEDDDKDSYVSTLLFSTHSSIAQQGRLKRLLRTILTKHNGNTAAILQDVSDMALQQGSTALVRAIEKADQDVQETLLQKITDEAYTPGWDIHANTKDEQIDVTLPGVTDGYDILISNVAYQAYIDNSLDDIRNQAAYKNLIDFFGDDNNAVIGLAVEVATKNIQKEGRLKYDLHNHLQAMQENDDHIPQDIIDGVVFSSVLTILTSDEDRAGLQQSLTHSAVSVTTAMQKLGRVPQFASDITSGKVTLPEIDLADLQKRAIKVINDNRHELIESQRMKLHKGGWSIRIK